MTYLLHTQKREKKIFIYTKALQISQEALFQEHSLNCMKLGLQNPGKNENKNLGNRLYRAKGDNLTICTTEVQIKNRTTHSVYTI